MKKTRIPKHVVKATYFANWGDIFGFPLAALILPTIAKVPFITPNIVTLTSFFSYLIGSASLFSPYPYHLYVSAFAFLFGFLCDDLDGQLARYKKLSSTLGDFMDKTLDVLKLFLLTFSLSLAVYLQTKNVLYIFLGFIACFFFNYRYYIKLETMFSRINSHPDYLAESGKFREKATEQLDTFYDRLSQSAVGKLQLFWHRNKIIFFVDEAEFAIFTSIGALFNRLDIVIWVLAVSQVAIGLLRLGERAYQLTKKPDLLLKPMRK